MTADAATASPRVRGGWRGTLATYAHPAVRAMLFLGFASGLPFPLVLTTLSVRLREAGIDRTTIGFFSLVGLAYSLKFFWSPVVDRLPLPLLHRLGRRRSWMLLAQCGVLGGLVAMALHDPARGAVTMAWLAVFTAFCSSTQDIVIDAFRIDSTPPDEQGPAVSAYATGYQIALICGGAGALVAATGGGWTVAYLTMAACMLAGPFTTLLVREPESYSTGQADADPALLDETIARMRPSQLGLAMAATLLAGAVLALALRLAKQDATAIVVAFGAVLAIELALLTLLITPRARPALERLTRGTVLPMVDFFRRQGARLAVPMLLLIVAYRLNYTTMGVAANTFYLDLGYTKDDIAVVAKVYGILMTIAGSLFAGWWVRRAGMMPALLAGVLLLSAANLYYAWLGVDLAPYMGAHLAHAADAPHPPRLWLTLAVSLDNVANGIALAAFIAWMSSLTSPAYTATQYALFGTLWSLPAKSIASQWGRIVDAFGYPAFFVYTAAIGLPALLLILWFMRRPAAPSPAPA